MPGGFPGPLPILCSSLTRSRSIAALIPETPDAWPQIQAALRSTVSESVYRIWLEPLRPIALQDGALLLLAPPETRALVAERFGRVLQACVSAVIGPEIAVDVVADAPPAERGSHTPPQRRVPRQAFAERPLPASPLFNPKLTFDQFVIGDSNRLAHAGALAVAELPGQAYNPLFIYGQPGLGKTHLLHSIANYVAAHGGGLTVRYSTVEAFTNEFVASLRGGSIDAFKAHFRRTDVLLLDDVQFLERKTKTEEELFHTFNALLEIGSQLVLTSDRLPRDLEALERRLRERFESGLVTDIQPPDLSTRLTILRMRARHDRVELADVAALEVIARRITRNIRALEGALIRVVAYASLTARPITAELATQALDALYPQARRQPVKRSVDDIQAAVARTYGVSVDELLSSRRGARVVWPRQVAMYLAREMTEQSLPQIGRAFGGRDHTTVLHACKRAAARLESDAEAHDQVRDLMDALSCDRK